MKECHYSVLQVDYKATFDEIRQSYKQLSLKWHPDKNRNNVEEATHRFQLIAAAYEVLSDPNERAWYDSHRKQILSEGNTKMYNENDPDYDPSEMNLWKYFSRDVFEDFNDEKNGFYTVYSKLFEDIIEEEIKYLSKDSSDYTFWKNANKFGDSKTNLEIVMEFYSFWSNFSSTRTFSWKDIWNLNQAQNRQIRRAMEAENNKERKKGKKEYNETIRKLVEYVKKRDPRVISYMRNKSEKIMKLQKEKEIQKKMEEEVRRRARDEARIEEMKRMEELDAERRELYGNDCLQEGDRDIECYETFIYTCKLCNKTFKSEQQLNSHIKSKRHISKLNDLKKNDPKKFDSFMNKVDSTEETDDNQAESDSLDNEKQSENIFNSRFGPEEREEASSLDDDRKLPEERVDKEEENEKDDEDEEEEEEEEEDDEISVEKITEMMDNLNRRSNKGKGRLNSFEDSANMEDGVETVKGSKKSKGKKKVDKTTKRNTNNNNNNNNNNVNNDKEIMWKCLVCNQVFESRNKLFIHVKEKNHAQIKSNSNYKNSKVKK
ncbi:DnaJ domain-containing protein [Cryptosporidium ubiquitum]|uniref:DnaJ domain-containing protein n=1 Tax=Cryptosporidium ubiquitum TaxID=857276 RepID=A0A1J4MR33_9CRYT|nr:DnaJ domain-containing protein [Cryptosporidium ubiquitum]OII75460.1 DnaJ domain-containing protein [Cryptosporidium ubiquitum]